MRDPEIRWTPREREVLDRLLQGQPNFQIAQELGITLDGVKWHVREILSKLSVASREEAAAYWQREHRVRRRVVRVWIAAFVAGGAVFVMVMAVFAFRLAGSNDEQDPAEGVVLPFGCNTEFEARRPTFDEMAETYARPRFLSTDGRLHPALFAMQLSSIYYNPIPIANSANIEPASFFRSVALVPGSELWCPGDATVHLLKLIDWRPIELRRFHGDHAVLTVERHEGWRHEVDFIPGTLPLEGEGPSPRALETLRVVDTSGNLIAASRSGGWELLQDGRIVYAYANNLREVERIPLRGPKQELRVFAVSAGSSAFVRVLDGRGLALLTFETETAEGSWEVLADFQVPEGAVEMVVEPGSPGGLIVLPAETQLPPDVR